MVKKYELTEEKILVNGRTLYRIRALRDFSNIKKGDIGGFIEKEDNLSHEDDCWISGNARIFENAQVFGDAHILGDARVFGKTIIKGNSRISKVYFANRSDGYTFTLLPQEDGTYMISAGCRYFTFEDAREHWKTTRGDTKLGVETMKILDYLESFIPR